MSKAYLILSLFLLRIPLIKHISEIVVDPLKSVISGCLLLIHLSEVSGLVFGGQRMGLGAHTL